MAILSPISQIKLPNGDIVPLTTNLKIVIPEDSEYNVTWNVEDFSGTVELIAGTVEDYMLLIDSVPAS